MVGSAYQLEALKVSRLHVRCWANNLPDRNAKGEQPHHLQPSTF
ncbi:MULTISPECIES: hypothetical protein [Moorena]|nr:MULTISPECIES: hypothetical protein [Moorena]